MVDVDTISIVLTGIGLIIALTYYALTIRNQSINRQAQLFMSLAKDILSRETLSEIIDLLSMQWEDSADFYRKYDHSVNKENFVKRFHYWMLMDQVGVLLMKGLIDKELVYHLLGGYSTTWTWQKFKPIIMHQREYQNFQELGVGWEYFAQEMMKMREERGYTNEWPDDPTIRLE